eukprot:22824-Eustigmatos_ZCMA.PRE.1
MVNCCGSSDFTRSEPHGQHHHDYGDRDGHHHRHGANHQNPAHADGRSHNHSPPPRHNHQQQHRTSD